MAEERKELIKLAEKHRGSDALEDSGQHALQSLMELEVESQVGASERERSDDHAAQRNGYRDLAYATRPGTMALRIPRLRPGNRHPAFFEPRNIPEHARAMVVQEAYVQGVSTRTADEHVQAIGMTGISKSKASRLCG